MADSKTNTVTMIVDASTIKGLVREHIENLAVTVNDYDTYEVFDIELRDGNYDRDDSINVSVTMKFEGEES
ncbi:MAG: hypothetical protein COB36_11450 [Alphaproteobacteria bacterium]|nr:MAG: hypothetical protein COB36_11450 [Alphaproteobacteria bacterium]